MMRRSRGEADIEMPEGPIVSRSTPAPTVSARAVLASRDRPRITWASPSGLEIAGAEAAATLSAGGRDRFEKIRRGSTSLFEHVDHEGPDPTRPRLIGGFSFEADHREESPWVGFPAATFVLPRVQLTSHEGNTWLTVAEVGPDADPESVESTLSALTDSLGERPAMHPAGNPPGVTEIHRTPNRAGWRQQVRAALSRIESGSLRKVVLAQRLDAKVRDTLSVPALLERVRRRYPDCFRFLVEPRDGAAFFGAPPERLVRRDGQQVQTEALAGSVPRGETPETDASLAKRLKKDETLRIEQSLVAEEIESALDPLGTVTVGKRDVRRLSNIQHLRTPIEATLEGDTHVLDLVATLHPTPAVGGLPLTEALSTIRRTESFQRGWYAAPIGWFDGAGDGEFAVGIRSGVVENETVALFAGNGIVDGADPEEEWTELQQKYRPILDELE